MVATMRTGGSRPTLSGNSFRYHCRPRWRSAKRSWTLPETLADVTDEQSVREIVADLNHRIAESHGAGLMVRRSLSGLLMWSKRWRIGAVEES